jgi:hypothetical protein
MFHADRQISEDLPELLLIAKPFLEGGPALGEHLLRALSLARRCCRRFCQSLLFLEPATELRDLALVVGSNPLDEFARLLHDAGVDPCRRRRLRRSNQPLYLPAQGTCITHFCDENSADNTPASRFGMSSDR